jgi:hypothetical protein
LTDDHPGQFEPSDRHSPVTGASWSGDNLQRTIQQLFREVDGQFCLIVDEPVWRILRTRLQ